MVFQTFYCIGLIFIKTSVCSAFLRLTISRAIRIYIWIIICLSVTTSVAAVLVILFQCRPLRATWDPSAGHCASSHVIVNISLYISASSIVTDFSCILIPAIILKSLQMKRRLKVTISLIMGLGFVSVRIRVRRLMLC